MQPFKWVNISKPRYWSSFCFITWNGVEIRCREYFHVGLTGHVNVISSSPLIQLYIFYLLTQLNLRRNKGVGGLISLNCHVACYHILALWLNAWTNNTWLACLIWFAITYLYFSYVLQLSHSHINLLDKWIVYVVLLRNYPP